MAGINTEVIKSGKLFTQPETVLNYHLNLMSTKLAKEAQQAIRFTGQAAFRYERSQPTFRWNKSIQITAAVGGLAQVTDSGIIYGPWLEGVSTRNQTTRFKGYHTFRKVRQQIEQKAPELLAPNMAKMAKDLES